MTPTIASQSMTGYLPFSWDGHSIRTEPRPDGTVWFIAQDVCAALGIVNTAQATGRLDEDQKGICTVYTPGGQQSLSIINESGLHDLVWDSRKPEARVFRKWVTGTVLPSLRKHGAYAVGAEHLPQEAQALLYSQFQVQLKEALRRYDRLTEHDHWRAPHIREAASQAAIARVSKEMGLPLTAIQETVQQGAEMGLKAFLKTPAPAPA